MKSNPSERARLTKLDRKVLRRLAAGNLRHIHGPTIRTLNRLVAFGYAKKIQGRGGRTDWKLQDAGNVKPTAPIDGVIFIKEPPQCAHFHGSQAMKGLRQDAPAYVMLDTYEAMLLNERPGRRESVTEIQDGELGDLLCYASPDKASFIARACGGYDEMISTLKMLRGVRNFIARSTKGKAKESLLGCCDWNRVDAAISKYGPPVAGGE